MSASGVDVPPAMAGRLRVLAESPAGREQPAPALTGAADPASLRAWLTAVGADARRALAACEELHAEAEEWLSVALEARDLAVLCDELAAAHRVAREAAVAHALHELRAVGNATRCSIARARCSSPTAVFSGRC